MIRTRRGPVTLVPLEDVSVSSLDGFLEAYGVSRYSSERPYAADRRCGYLLRRVLEDGTRDDAVSLAALREHEVVGTLVLRFPEWDAEHFGFVVGRVEHLQGADEEVLSCLAGGARQRLRARDARMCSARVSNDSVVALHSLEEVGFRYVEVTLAPWLDLSTWEMRGFGVTRAAEPGDVDRMCAIARAAFRTDRFHRDRRFSSVAADGVYEKWIRTWYEEPSDNRLSRVIMANDEVAGFFLFEVMRPNGDGGDTVTSLVLDGVDPALAGRGMGFHMYCDVVDVAKATSAYATVCVAAANPAVINLYAKLGFRLTSSGEVTMHWWPEG